MTDYPIREHAASFLSRRSGISQFRPHTLELRNRYPQIRDLLLRLMGATTIYCLGDSHLQAFEYVAQFIYFWHTRFEFCIVHGATAMGLPNPASRTQGGPIFRAYVQQVPRNGYILTCLGEVDCGFVIWYRSQKYGDAVEKQFERSIHNYCDLLGDIEKEHCKKVIVCSAPLPTIEDDQDWGQVASMRREVKATLRERTDLTIEFNEKMRQYCRNRGLIFLDLEADILNPWTRLVDARFLSSNPFDHHLENESFAQVIVARMKMHGFW